jgi:hypothetical protein
MRKRQPMPPGRIVCAPSTPKSFLDKRFADKPGHVLTSRPTAPAAEALATAPKLATERRASPSARQAGVRIPVRFRAARRRR